MANNFILRKASLLDREKIFTLSNDPTVRENSIHGKQITWPEHVAWFDAMLSNPACIFFIAETLDGKFIGQVRFFQEQVENIVSISLCDTFRSRGFGRKILIEAIKKNPSKSCTAYVKSSNCASQKIFEQAGFQFIRHEQINNQIYKVYKYEK